MIDRTPLSLTGRKQMNSGNPKIELGEKVKINSDLESTSKRLKMWRPDHHSGRLTIRKENRSALKFIKKSALKTEEHPYKIGVLSDCVCLTCRFLDLISEITGGGGKSKAKSQFSDPPPRFYLSKKPS